jgi:hypothetical protein
VAEANKYVAGVWRRSRVTRGQMALAARYNEWSRGAAGLGAVVASLFRLSDTRPYHDPAESHATTEVTR